MIHAAILGASLAAHEPRVEWSYQRFTAVEGVVTVTMGLGIGAFVLFNKERPPAWTSNFVIDDSTRDVLRADTLEGRRRAAFIGDMTYYGSLAYPYLVDVVAVAWLGHGKPGVAAQMALINTEAFAITGFLSFASNAFIRRQRPYARDCTESDRETFPDCKLPGKSEGFFSGHTGIAATAAGLTCSHHRHLPLYGGGVPDAMACVATIAGALLTGYTRLAADKHYLFDVITGLGLGFPIGYWLAEYHYRTPTRTTTWSVRPMPMVSTTMAGVGAFAIF